MDKLKPVLEQKFWVLAGLAIILSPIGWWMSTSTIADTTSKRINSIKGNDKKAEDLKKPGAKYPNKTWIAEAAKVKTELTELVNDTHRSLYNRQREKMVWEPIVQSALAKAKVKTRNDKEDLREFLDVQTFFVATYDAAWKRIVAIIDPFDWMKGDGKVWVDQTPGAIAKKDIGPWRTTLVFTKDEMWDVEEDLWLLQELMQAIARVNQGATQISDAHIKKVTQLLFRGGDTTDLAARKAGTVKDPSGNPSTAAASQRGGVGMRINLSEGGGGADAQVHYTPPKDFDPDDVFGADGSTASSQSQTRRDKKDAGPTAVLKRDVDSSDQKWRKRGFVLRVVMDERQIPTLVAELTASAFPVEIRHIEHSEYDNSKDIQQITSATAVAPSDFANSPSANGGAQATEESRLQKIQERIRSVLNQNYLVDVIIAGTMTIYDNPPNAGTSPANAAPQPAGIVDPKAMAAAPGQNAVPTGKPGPGATMAAGKSPTAGSPAAAAAAANPVPSTGIRKSGSDAGPPATASKAGGTQPVVGPASTPARPAVKPAPTSGK